MNNYDKLVYRVGTYEGDKTQFKNQSVFFSDSLDYYDHSMTGYDKRNAQKYYLNLKDFKVFDPMVEWADDLDVASWCEIRTTEEFCDEHNIYIADYLDGVDYDDPDEYHEVLIDTDSLAKYGRENGYDVTILRDIPSDYGSGPEFTEYAVHNSNCIKSVDAKEFNKSSYNINEDFNINEVYSRIVVTETEKLNKFLDDYNFEIELIDDYEFGDDSVGMFLNSIQDDACVFPIALNKEVILDYSGESIIELTYAIRGTLAHEVGHGLFGFLNDVYNLDEFDEEEIVEEFARDYGDNLLENNELMKILHQYENEELNEDLTQQQEEYFKNSKIRDKQGNLLVCYHGASKPGFKEFNPSSASSQFGKYKFGNANVNYFTTDKKSATSYTNIGIEKDGNVYACYLNVVNPFIVDNKSLANVKSSFNIKDDRIRQKQMSLFDNLWNKYGGMYPDEDDLDNINNILRKLNFEIRPSSERKDNTNYTTEDGYYDLYTLGNNSLYGVEGPVMYAYTLEELFDDDMYDEVKETIVGYDEDDYYLSTDNIVRYVLAMNEEDGTNYDGIIISDIVDSKDMFALAGTDVITLKSSNQIKLISNKNPSNSNNIDEGNINIPPVNKNSLESKKQGNTKVLEESDSKWQVQSEKVRNMGTYDTKGEAEKRLKQIEYFKHLDEQTLDEGGNYANLYHKTSLENAIKILKDNTLKVGGNYVYNIKNGPCTYFSRDLSFIKSMPGREYVIFVVNKDRLTNNYKLTPISDNKNSFFGPTKARYSGNSKAEEICMKDITNFSQYVDEILVPSNCYDKFIGAIGKTPIKITKLTEGLIESYILNEKTRAELINKSKNADRYKDQSKGKDRYERRLKSRVANSVAQYNKIDMDSFFKRDVLTVGIDVQGETNNYVVTMKFNGVLNEIARDIKANNGKLEFKIIARAMSRIYNSDNIKLHCSCLHPDTKIKLLDGTTPTIKEMCDRFNKGEELWVYSVDSKGDFKPGKVDKVWLTKNTTDFVKVTLDNGEEILTTPEHPYMLRDGSYIIADKLQEGHSLMPVYTSQTKNGYETVKLNSTNKYHSVYKLVTDELYKSLIDEAKTRASEEDNMKYDVAIHHKDFNKHNNNPSNLQVMTAREHWDYHASLCGKDRPVTERMREVARQGAIKRNENLSDNMILARNKWREKETLRNYDEDRKLQQSALMRDTMKHYYASITKEELEQINKKRYTNSWREAVGKSNKNVWKHYSEEEYAKLCEINKLSNIKIRENKIRRTLQRVIDNKMPLTLESYLKCRIEKDITTRKIKEVYGIFENMLNELGYNDQFNHRVVKVEHITLNTTPVYDIKVDKWENFTLDAGIVVHNCPDWKYRQAYWADKGGYGTQYEPRPSDITNPNDTKGGGCKHSLLVMSNLDWMMKVSSVLNNYIKYCQKNLQKNYADYIFPKIYGMPYQKAVQLSLFDDGLLPSDQALLTKVASTNLGDKDEKGRWATGNKYKFQKTNPEQEVKPEPAVGQKTIFDDEEDEREYKIEKGRYGDTVKTYRVSPDRNNLGRFAPGNTVSRKKPLDPTLGTNTKKQIVPSNNDEEKK